MALSLKDLKTTAAVQPPRVLIYGPPGLGKTSLAAEFPKPVIFDIERGIPRGLSIPHFDALDSYDAVMEAITALYNEDHDYGTVIVDTLDRYEPMLWAKLCETQKWHSIEDPGYGKGYVLADPLWRDFLDGLNALRRDKAMAVVLIAHSQIGTFDSPTSAPYSKYDIRLHKRALAMVQDEVDAILFLNQDATIKSTDKGFNKTHVHAEGGGTRWVYCEARPAFTAKNRFGMPEKFIFEKGKGFAKIAEFFGAPAAPVETEKPAKASKKAA